jgi:putative oxidoreductase
MSSTLSAQGSVKEKNMTGQSSAAAGGAGLAAERAGALLFGTKAHWSGPILRLALALVMFPHGVQKAFGWFGGYGWSGTMGFFTGAIGLPAALAALVILIELLAPLALLLGVATRAAALGIVAIMIGAIATVHGPYGFFMNWSGQLGGEGFEYHLLAIGMALALVAGGAGRFSLDARLDPRGRDRFRAAESSPSARRDA